MRHYIVSSETPITAREVSGGSPETGLPGVPDTGGPGRPSWPERPGHGLPPTLPPKDEWPPLPPWLQPGPGLPIPPTPEFPMVPIPPGEEVDPPEGIWPPVKPEFPDFEGKTLALAYVFVSRHVSKLCWIVIDHEEAKEKMKEAWEKVKDHLPQHPSQRPPRPQPK